MANNNTEKDSEFVGGMQFLGGVAGFLWGGTIGAEDPEAGFWIGAFVGALLGAGAGWVTGKTLESIYKVAFTLISLSLIALKFYNIFNPVTG